MSRPRALGPPRFVVVDKSSGPTSFDCVKKVRNWLGERRVGHGGTLDPFATGVLVCAAGTATRLLGLLSEGDKEYEAELQFGVLTDSLDPTGEVVEERAAEFTTSQLEAACREWVGQRMQVPPRLSAVRVDGQRSYRRFREGDTEFELEARAVRIETIDVLEHRGERARIRVVCGGGTYIRSLARDLAVELGTVAHLRALRRTRVGDFRLEDSIGYEELERRSRSRAPATDGVLPAARLVRAWPRLELDATQATRLRQGRQPDASWLSLPEPLPSHLAFLDSDGELVAVAETRDRQLRLRTVLPGPGQASPKAS